MGRLNPQRQATQHHELKENSMHESASTITITEYQLIANATVECLSDLLKTECVHPQLKGFTFSDGQTIHMCPDCTKFDAHRRAVLAGTKGGVIPRLQKTEEKG
jgi:hypothetical protein